MAAPSFGQAATFTGACFLLITSLMYMVAAYKGEVWIDPTAGSGDDGGKKGKRGKGGIVSTDRSSRPPSRPPARQRQSSDMEWQTSPLSAPSQTDAQGYALGAPSSRGSGSTVAMLS